MEDIRPTTRDSPVPGRLSGYQEGWVGFIDWESRRLTGVDIRCFTGSFRRTSERHAWSVGDGQIKENRPLVYRYSLSG